MSVVFVGVGSRLFTRVVRHSQFENVPVCFASILASFFVAEDAFKFCLAARLFLWLSARGNLSFPHVLTSRLSLTLSRRSREIFGDDHNMSQLHQNKKTRARSLAAFLAFNFLVAFKPATLASMFHDSTTSKVPEYTASLEELSDVSEGSLLPLLSFSRLVYSLSELNRFLSGCKSEEVLFKAIKTPLPTKVLLAAVASDHLFHLLVLTVDRICGTAEPRTGEAGESRQHPPPPPWQRTFSLMGAAHASTGTGTYLLMYLRYNNSSSVDFLAFDNSIDPPYRLHWISPDDYRLDFTGCLYVHAFLCKSLAVVYFLWC